MAARAGRHATADIPGWEVTGAAETHGCIVCAERLHREDDLVMYRVITDASEQPLIVKAPFEERASRELLASFEKEYSLRESIDTQWGIRPRELFRSGGQFLLTLHNCEGVSLGGEIALGRSPQRFLALAVSLASALKGMHANGLVHHNLSPANLFADWEQRVWITGFGSACGFEGNYAGGGELGLVPMTQLPYLAPERTSAVSQRSDPRSDLYSLGVLLYQLLSGQMPYEARERDEWIYSHLVSTPRSLRNLVPGIRPEIEFVINKLLAKAADDRYQSAAGVEADLQLCLDEMTQGTGVSPALLGRGDRQPQAVFPVRTYGRQRELEQLHGALERVRQTGDAMAVIVEGEPGVGKTFFIEEFKRNIGSAGVHFTLGKFDQYNDNVPYAAFVQVLRGLVRPLLRQTGPEVALWKGRFEDAVGKAGRLIVNLVPEIGAMVGPQPAIEALPPQEATNRFLLVVKRFLMLFSDKQRPLVLFLDDVQWLDSGTLELIDGLASDAELKNLLLVLAHRSIELGRSRVASERLSGILFGRKVTEKIGLLPLTLADVVMLIAETLVEPPEAVAPLASVIFERTGGNPFFTIEFLRELIQDRLIVPDAYSVGWTWDIDKIRDKGYTDNVVDLLTLRLTRLNDETKHVLAFFACVGGTARVGALARVLGTDSRRVLATMREAETAGLVSRKGEAYRFAHDRVQEAAYAMLGETARELAHAQIGTNLLFAMPTAPSTAEVFEVVGHLNRSQRILSQADRARLAELDVQAGNAAKAAAAWSSAREYFAQAEKLIVQYGVSEARIDVFRLLLDMAECESLTGDFGQALETAHKAFNRAGGLLKRAAALRMEIRIHQASGDYRRAIDTTLMALALLNVEVQGEGIDDALVAQKLAELRELCPPHQVAALLTRGCLEDPMHDAVIGLIIDAIPSAYIGVQKLFPILVLKAAELCLTHGNTRLAGYVYAIYALLLVGTTREFDLALRFSELALAVNERYGESRLTGTLQHLHGDHILIWRRPFRAAIPVLSRAMSQCVEAGDFIYAGYIAFESIWQAYERGEHLNEVTSLCRENLRFANELRNKPISVTIELELMFLLSLQGVDAADQGMASTHEALVAVVRESQFGCGIAFAAIMEMKLDFLHSRFASTVVRAREIEPLLGAVMAMPIEVTYYFLRALALMRVIDEVRQEAGQEAARELMERELIDAIDRLKSWAQSAPENFGSRYTLVTAEYARLVGDYVQAEQEYERAIELARENGQPHYEAMARECSAHFYLQRGLTAVSHACLRSARDAYARWGADAKVRSLEQAFHHLRDSASTALNSGGHAAPLGTVDVAAMVQLSQAVSSEIDLDKLVQAFMQIAVRHSGAQRALLILWSGESFRIVAEAGFAQNGITVEARDMGLCETVAPLTVIRHVMRVQENVVIDDGAEPNDFCDDRYLSTGRCRSLLCLPLLRHGGLVGVLYMENGVTPYVFDVARINLMNMLATQAAISIENARLYSALKRENVERRQTEARLRRSEAFLEEGQRISKTGTFIWNTITNELLWSRENYALWGVDFTCERPTIEMCLARVHVDDHLRFKEVFVKAISEDATHSFEFSTVQDDGSLRRLQVIFRPWSSDESGAREYIGATIDITDRRAYEDALRRGEMYLSEAQRLSNIGSIGWNVESRDMTCSAQTYRILEMDEPARPHMDLMLERIHPDDVDQVRRALREAEEGASIIEAEYRVRVETGAVKYLRMMARPIESASRAVEYVGALADMTEIHQAQNALLRAQAELTHVTRVSTLGELTASLAHDLKQPLMAIITHGEAGMRWLDRAVPSIAEARNNLARIVSDADRASEVINRLRALARKERPNRAAIDLTQTVTEVIALVRQEMEKNNIRLRVVAEDGLPRVAADKIQIQQVIMNLIFNGMHSILKCPGSTRVLKISAELVGAESVRVCVCDSGTGIAADIVDRLFEPFFTTKSDGMGLGLSICRSIIEEHRGSIWAFNNQDAGATFCFELCAAGSGTGDVVAAHVNGIAA
ncbi:trifunctional serine/threonine-protein kinase/ATP-binding protein/sensor histidine kinase [Paraburkholderia guartelaensis]|nr:trifunctional serine/threonine-protein kinase/ATP-binding protein/sensor histidine kinase [Paraburkholderia guartelaensis]